MILAKKTASAEITIVGDKTRNYNYEVQQALQPGWDDVSSIENWDSLWPVIGRDYKVARTEIFSLAWAKMLGDPANWDNLTDAEKEISARWFVVPKELRDTVFSTSEQIPLSELFDANSIEARRIRYTKAKYEIYNRLTLAQANTIIQETENSISAATPNLREMYVTYGREGVVEGDPEGLFDYVRSQAGTSFASSGLGDHDYVPVGYADMPSLAAAIFNILKYGIY